MDKFERIKKVLADCLMVDESEITPEKRIQEDLGADSLDAVELVLCLEEEFGIDISDEDAEEVKTVQDIINLLS